MRRRRGSREAGCSTSVKLLLAIVCLSLSCFLGTRCRRGGRRKTRRGTWGPAYICLMPPRLYPGQITRGSGEIKSGIFTGSSTRDYSGVRNTFFRAIEVPRRRSRSFRDCRRGGVSLLVAGGVARPLLLSCHTVHSRFHYPTGRRCGKSKFAPPVVLLQRLREASFERDQVSLPFLLFLRKVITRNILRTRIFPSRFFNRRRITTLVYTHRLKREAAFPSRLMESAALREKMEHP